MSKFGELLRKYRRNCTDPERGGGLTQERLGELLGIELEIGGYRGATISNWERGKTKIAHDDRLVLVGLVTVLYQCNSIKSADDANQLLEVGNYRQLSTDESAKLFSTEGNFEQSIETTDQQVWEQEQWAKVNTIYAENMRNLYGTMRIFGQPKPVSVKDVYTHVYVLDKPTAWRKYNLERLQQRWEVGQWIPEHHAKKHPGLDMVQTGDNIFILGKPGAGKTTFLKFITLQALSHIINKVPIFVTLKDYADSSLTLSQFIEKQFEICSFSDGFNFIKLLLEKGNAILLFDGLDEVTQIDGRQAELIKDLDEFSRQYNKCQTLITCRIAASHYEFELFTTVEMADFNKPQIRAFVGKWFSEHEMREMFLEELEKPENVRLWELARIPLLLTLLCLSFEETLTFPKQRVEIYEEAIEALLKKWDISRKIRRDIFYKRLSNKRKLQLFAEIAYATFRDSQYFTTQKKIESLIGGYLQRLLVDKADEVLDNEEILKAIEAHHGILVERAYKIYSFAHITFQEYFTARYILESQNEGTLQTLMVHIDDDRWREVFFLTVGSLIKADKFFELFIAALKRIAHTQLIVQEMLVWADSRAAYITADVDKMTAYRSHFICFALSLDLNCIHTLTLALDLNRYHAHALGLNRALDLARARDLVHARIHVQLNKTTPISKSVQTTIPDLTTIVFEGSPSLKWSLDYCLMWGSYNGVMAAIIYSEQLGLLELSIALEALLQLYTTNKINHNEFMKRKLALAQEYRNLKSDWQLSDKDAACWDRYLKGNQLLLECLEVAAVTDRAAIKAQLLKV